METVRSEQKRFKYVSRPGGRAHALRSPYFLCGLLLFVSAYLIVQSMAGVDLFKHDPLDSYTEQAMRWRVGEIALAGDIPYLELAIYEGAYYVSFPPFPTVPMYLLTFLFEGKTPNTLLVFLCYTACYIVAYKLAYRFWRSSRRAMLMALFLTLGCSLFAVSMMGRVWYIAQVMSFLLSLLAVYGVCCCGRAGQAWGLVAIACAVGCRPFQAVFVPFLLLVVYVRADGSFMKRIRYMLPMVAVPALIAALYAAYNLIRFGDVFEFGHTYLPEFTRSADGQFNVSYVLQNFENILRLPRIADGALSFDAFGGSAFYLANALYVFAAYRAVRSAGAGRMRSMDWLLLLLCAVQFFLLLMHKSFGGWQFGARYLCDMLPFLFLFVLAQRRRPDPFEYTLMSVGVLFNLIGTVLFHRQWL